MRAFVPALVVALSWPGTPAGARDVLRLQPSTKWVLEYADENCRLIRSFGQGDQQISLVLDQFEPGDQFRVMLVGKPLKVRSGTANGRLRFGPNEAESKFEAEAATLGEKPALLVLESQRLAPLTREEQAASDRANRRGDRFDPAPIGTAREAAATWLEVTRAVPQDLVLVTGPMSQPMAALRKCSWDTVKHWGLDVEQQKTLTRKVSPKNRAAAWLNPSDYPASMVRGGYQGLVTVRMIVDSEGKPTSCHVQWSTQPKEFDAVVCGSTMTRARFEPALDAQGKPVPSFYVLTVRFQLHG